MDEKRKIEVVPGDGDLEISPVYEHIEIQKPKNDERKENIVIPEEKESIQEKSEEDEEN